MGQEDCFHLPFGYAREPEEVGPAASCRNIAIFAIDRVGAGAGSGSLWRQNFGQALGRAVGRALENCNSEDHSRVESVRTRRHVVRGADDLLPQLRRQRWTVLHGLFDACGHRVPLGDS